MPILGVPAWDPWEYQGYVSPRWPEAAVELDSARVPFRYLLLVSPEALGQSVATNWEPRLLGQHGPGLGNPCGDPKTFRMLDGSEVLIQK